VSYGEMNNARKNAINRRLVLGSAYRSGNAPENWNVLDSFYVVSVTDDLPDLQALAIFGFHAA
jgi:hypothetical protein